MKYEVTSERIKSGKRYRKDFEKWRVHSFKYPWWIKSIGVDLNCLEEGKPRECSHLVSIHYKIGIKMTYLMGNISVYYLLRDCGFKDTEIESHFTSRSLFLES
jgi:hypothetical protein